MKTSSNLGTLQDTISALQARVKRPMPEGYIATERISLLPLFRGVKGAIGEKIFRYLCERARFVPGVVQIYGQDVALLLQPGQLWTRTRQIEQDIGISKSTVAIWLRRLETEGLIRMDVHPSNAAGAGFSVVTIARHLLAGGAPATLHKASPNEKLGTLSVETPPPLSVPADEKNSDLLNNSSLDKDEGEEPDRTGASSTQGASNEVEKPEVSREMPERLPGEGRYAYACRVNGWNVVKGGSDDDRRSKGSGGGSEATGNRKGHAKSGTAVTDPGEANTAEVYDFPNAPRWENIRADRPGAEDHSRAREADRSEDPATDRSESD